MWHQRKILNLDDIRITILFRETDLQVYSRRVFSIKRILLSRLLVDIISSIGLLKDH